MLKGSCHCGEVKWSYEVPLEGVTACNCNLCRRYGALWAYGFLNEGITVSGKTSVYMYSAQHSGFNFCSRCGGITYYIANKLNEQGKRKAAVNMRMVTEPERIAQVPIDHFEGLVAFEDLPRDGRCVKDLWF